MRSCFKMGISALICLMVLVAGTAAALAVSYTTADYSVFLNDKKLEFDQSPVNVDGRILVPMRAIFEAFGADITWDQDKQKITAKTASTKVVLTVDSKVAYVNSKKKTMDTPAMIINGRTVVPLRFIADVFDAEVEWDPYSSSVKITSEHKVAIETVSRGSVEARESVSLSENNTAAANTASKQTTKSSDNISNKAGFFSTQQGISGACYLTCLGMISSNLNNTEIYASEVYAMNGNTVNQHDYFGLLKKLNITRTTQIKLSEKSNNDKVNTVVSLLKDNPEGVIIRFLNSRSHYIVCKGYENGKLIVNDPVGQIYVPLDKCWTGYSMCNGYDDAISCLAIVESFSKGSGTVQKSK